MSAQNWAIAVWNQAFDTRKAVYSWTSDSITLVGDGVVSPSLANIQQLEYWVTPNEDSLDATWLGDSNGNILNISSQDRILIYTKGYRAGETASTYYCRWRGIASIPANQNHVDGLEHQYRALGISRLLETTDTGPNHVIDEGQDLASDVADTIIAALPDGLPAGITHTSFSAIGVTNTGKTNPGSADLHQNLQALVTLCQTAGVSAAAGVKPSGALFFEALNTDTIGITEGETGTIVEWAEPQADEIITAVRWIIADGNSDRVAFDGLSGVSLTTPDQLTYLSDSGITAYGKRTIALTPPSEVNALIPIEGTFGISPSGGSLHTSWVGGTQDATATLSRVTDGDPISYAVFTSNALGNVALRWQVTTSEGYSPGDLVVLSASFAADPDSDEPDTAHAHYFLESASGGLSVHVIWGESRQRSDGSVVTQHVKSLPRTEHTLVLGDRAVNTSLNEDFDVSLVVTADIEATAVETARVAVGEFRIWKINTDALDALAEQEYKFPEADAFTARKPGEIQPAALADIMKFSGSSVTGLPVTAFGTRITGDSAVETLLTVGPRTPAHVTEEQNRIKRRDRLAALAGAKAGRGF